MKIEVLEKSAASWNGTLYARYPGECPEITVIKISIPPNTVLPWHTHPLPSSTYVISGTMTLEDRFSGEKRVIKAGDVVLDSMNEAHRGFTGEDACVVVNTYSGTPGTPLSIPEPGEDPEFGE